jgi:hypothetical protein
MGKTAGRRSIAYLCIAAVLLSALVPGLSLGDYAVPEPGWVLLADLAARHRPVPVGAADVVALTRPAPARLRAPPHN